MKDKILDLIKNDSEVQNRLLKCDSKAKAVRVVQSELPEAKQEDIDQAVRELVQQVREIQTQYLEQEEKGENMVKADTVTTATTVTTITLAASSYAFM